MNKFITKTINKLLCRTGYHHTTYEWIDFLDNELWKFNHCQNCHKIVSYQKMIQDSSYIRIYTE
jgi:hypothetical protein